MLSLHAIFWMFVILFGIIGAMRGWAKELLVTFAAILALFLLNVLESYVPFISQTLRNSPEILFWLRIIVLIGTIFFGYQSPNLQRLAGSNRFARERLQDILLGFLLGGINAYLFVGTFWFYLDQAQYPWSFITPPDAATQVGAGEHRPAQAHAAQLAETAHAVLRGGAGVRFCFDRLLIRGMDCLK